MSARAPTAVGRADGPGRSRKQGRDETIALHGEALGGPRAARTIYGVAPPEPCVCLPDNGYAVGQHSLLLRHDRRPLREGLRVPPLASAIRATAEGEQRGP